MGIAQVGAHHVSTHAISDPPIRFDTWTFVGTGLAPLSPGLCHARVQPPRRFRGPGDIAERDVGPVIAGGAWVDWAGGHGSVLCGDWPTLVFDDPQDALWANGWEAMSTEYFPGHHDEATLHLWCLTADLPREAVYVARGAYANWTGVVEAEAKIPPSYSLVGGGARTVMQKRDGEIEAQPALLVSSRPTDSGSGWTAVGTDHAGLTYPVCVEAYAVGIRSGVLQHHHVITQRKHDQGHIPEDWPTARVSLLGPDSRGVVTCGGAEPAGTTLQFLTRSYPDSLDCGHARSWTVASKDHGVAAPTFLEAWGLAILAA